MLYILRRLVGKPSHSAATLRLGADIAQALADGMCRQDPLTPAEMAHLAAYTERAIRRSWPAQYDED
ncbi:hypothetical protein ABZ379_33785 [Streptomyces canus]|uniref:hypothetical protein n=1 Tax=Streptomyces canus TaxID=58343 RepID=UPI0033DF9B77